MTYHSTYPSLSPSLPPSPPLSFSVNGDGVTVGSKGSDLKTSLRKDFPLALVEGQENIKTALLLTAINPEIQGVIISGEHGVGKTVMARGTCPLPSLPPSSLPPTIHYLASISSHPLSLPPSLPPPGLKNLLPHIGVMKML